MTLEPTQLPTPQLPTPLLRHRSRPEWGYAVLAYENKGRGAYQFSDGKIRLFGEGFRGHFERTKPPEDDLTLAKKLAAMCAEAGPDRGRKKKRRRKKIDATFTQQLRLFHELYPRGFEGDRWQEDSRGVGARRRKRHRDVAIKAAGQLLPAHIVRRLVTAGQGLEVMSRVAKVLKKSDLVSPAQAKFMNKLHPADAQRVAVTFNQLLGGPSNAGFNEAFDRLVTLYRRELGKKPSWRLVTAPLALWSPRSHVFVRGSVMRDQAAVLGAEFTSGKPVARCYQEALAITAQLEHKLRLSGMSPRDGLDVTDFMWLTLRPAAREELLALPEEPVPLSRSQHAQESSSSPSEEAA